MLSFQEDSLHFEWTDPHRHQRFENNSEGQKIGKPANNETTHRKEPISVVEKKNPSFYSTKKKPEVEPRFSNEFEFLKAWYIMWSKCVQSYEINVPYLQTRLTLSPHSWNILFTIFLFFIQAETHISSISRMLWIFCCISAIKADINSGQALCAVKTASFFTLRNIRVYKRVNQRTYPDKINLEQKRNIIFELHTSCCN